MNDNNPQNTKIRITAAQKEHCEIIVVHEGKPVDDIREAFARLIMMGVRS